MLLPELSTANTTIAFRKYWFSSEFSLQGNKAYFYINCLKLVLN